MVTLIFRVVLCAGLAAVLFCSRDYDPFADLANAKAHVLSWSFSEKDQVPVYSTGTLVIGVAARDEVDSFSLHALHNRFWQDTTVRRASPGEILGPAPFSFSVSFFDTGVQTVTVTTWRVNGESVIENTSVRVTMPLDQEDVTDFFGDSVVLSTPPVPDGNVFYKWEFGPGRVVKSPKNTVKAVFNGGTGAGTGTLCVTDLDGNHATPAVVFSFSLFDTSCPIILCANTNIHDDTLVTSDSILAFKAYIADYRDIAVDSCSVNQDAFDIAYPRTHMYIKLFRNMAGHTRQSGPLGITVYAMNYSGPNRDRASMRTFWALFDPSGPSTPYAHISFIIPSKDSSTTATRDFRVFGTAENYQGNSMVLRVTVNDSAYVSPCVISGSSGIWEWPVHLDSYFNSITVTAYDQVKKELTSAHVVVVYDPTMEDRIKPMIWEISAGGKPAGNLYTQQTGLTLQVIAFDEGTGIQGLTIDNSAVAPDSSGYIWHPLIGPLVHSASGNTFVIRAEDRNQNVKDTAITVFLNTAPVLAAGPAIPDTFCVGSTITFRIPTFDADNDPVSVIKVSAPASMSISNDGTISWTPGASDVGIDTFEVRLYDGFQYSAPIMWTVNCVNCSRPIVPVRFTTRDKDFPAVLQAGVDTLRIRLQVDSAGAGAAGAVLMYSAKFIDRNEVVLVNDTSSLLLWPPALADTGFRTLMVTVGNGTTAFDTITSVLWVVPRNQYPCSLSYTFTGDTFSTGQLDLFTHQKPETLFFAIQDLDNPLTEKYTVTISRHSLNSIETLNTKDFFIVIQPDSTRTMDTIRVHVRDITGTSDSATFIVRYSILNPYPSWQHSQSLVLNTTASGADVAGTVNDFPVLVRLTNGNFIFSQAAPNGDDIRFAKPDGTILPFQIERWVPAEQGGAELWVNVDTVYGNNATQSITMYWGALTGPATVSLSNGAATFDTANGFQAVWHLGGTGSDPVLDATGNHYNGVPTGLSSGAMTGGMIGECQRFNGTQSYIVMPGTAASKLNFPERGIYSVSAWVNTVGFDGQFHTIASKGDMQYSLEINVTTNDWEFAECRAASGYTVVQSPSTAGAWTYLTGVRNGVGQSLYVNGVLADSGIFLANSPQARSTASDFTLGKMPEMAAYFFNGMMDEVRVSSTAPSADWIKLCYMNQKAVDALVVFK